MKRSSVLLLVLMLVFVAAASACSGGNGGQNGKSDSAGTPSAAPAPTASAQPTPEPTPEKLEPITIHVLTQGKADTFDETFKSYPGFKEKFPHVTFEAVPFNDREQYLVSGKVPDLVEAIGANHYWVAENNLAFDHTALFEQHGLDLSLISSGDSEVLTNLIGGEGLAGLPVIVGNPYNPWALAYNKDIFDRFNVPYPTDNMTWEEVIELAKQLTRMEDGVQYYGLMGQNPPDTLRVQAGVDFMGADGKVDVSNPRYMYVLNTIKQMSAAQGNWTGLTGKTTLFFQDRTVAMMTGNIMGFIDNKDLINDKFNWDMVTWPRVAGEPILLPSYNSYYYISDKSEHKDLIAQMLKLKVIDNAGVEAKYESDDAKSKNLEAIKDKNFGAPIPTKYTQELGKIAAAHINAMLAENKDVNTVSREMQEEMQKKVDEMNR